MTLLIWNQATKTLSADGRACSGDVIETDDFEKIHDLRAQGVWAYAGSLAHIHKIQEWIDCFSLPPHVEHYTDFKVVLEHCPDVSVEGFYVVDNKCFEWVADSEGFRYWPISYNSARGSGAISAAVLLKMGYDNGKIIRSVADTLTTIGYHVFTYNSLSGEMDWEVPF